MPEGDPTDSIHLGGRPVVERARLVEARRWFDRRVPAAIGAGLFGALSIVVLFFAIDLAQGRPFETPAALGSAVFLGKPYSTGAPLPWVVIWGYTVLHGVVFVSMALLASMVVPTVVRWSRSHTSMIAGSLYTAALFVLLEVFFYVFDFVMLGAQASRLGGASVAIANLLAAGVMAFTLLRAGESVARASATSAT